MVKMKAFNAILLAALLAMMSSVPLVAGNLAEALSRGETVVADVDAPPLPDVPAVPAETLGGASVEQQLTTATNIDAEVLATSATGTSALRASSVSDETVDSAALGVAAAAVPAPREAALESTARANFQFRVPTSLRNLITSAIVGYWHDVATAVEVRDYSVYSGGPKEPPVQQPGPLYAGRAATICHLAAYDAFVGVTREAPMYLRVTGAPRTRNAFRRLRISISAVAGAMSTCLREFWSEQTSVINSALRVFELVWGREPDGYAWGTKVAEAHIDSRAADGSETGAFTNFTMPPPTADFVHTPDPVVTEASADGDVQQKYGERWRDVTPFGFSGPLKDRGVIELPGPPHEKFDYPADLAQVVAKGGNSTGERTDAELETGIFYAYDGAVNIGTPHTLFSQMIDSMVTALGGYVKYGTNAGGGAALLKLYAACNVAMQDGALQAWIEKYEWNFWRPTPAIRQGSSDPDTSAIEGWTAYGSPTTNSDKVQASPAFPAYPSGHAVIGTSGLRCAEILLGQADNPGFTFTFTSAEFNGKNYEDEPADGSQPRPLQPRKLTVDRAIEENQLSRLYLGVHWLFDSEQGAELGASIGPKVAAAFPKKV